jgi:hypothetical protein
MRPTSSTAALALLAMLAAAAPSAAQTLEVTPFIGAFLPVADMLSEDEFSGGHTMGVAGGARVTWQSGGRLGLSAAAMYAASSFEFIDDGNAFDSSARVLTFSGTVRVRLSHASARIQPHIAAGAAIMKRGGDAYDDFEWEGATDAGAILGAGVALPVGRRFRMEVEVEDFISSASVSEGSLTSEARLQNDIVVTVGVIIPVRGR